MEVNSEKERLKFTIQRFDHYYASVNTKGNVFLALGTFLVGGVIAYYPIIMEHGLDDYWLHRVIISLVLLGIINVMLILWAAIPFMKPNKSNSVHFFCSVAEMDQEQFGQKSKELSTDAELIDLRGQVHQLSRGLQRKFRLLGISGYFFLAKFVLLLIVIFLTINQTQLK